MRASASTPPPPGKPATMRIVLPVKSVSRAAGIPASGGKNVQQAETIRQLILILIDGAPSADQEIVEGFLAQNRTRGQRFRCVVEPLEPNVFVDGADVSRFENFHRGGFDLTARDRFHALVRERVAKLKIS